MTDKQTRVVNNCKIHLMQSDVRPTAVEQILCPLLQRFSTGGPRSTWGPQRAARGSARWQGEIIVLNYLVNKTKFKFLT